MEFKIKREAGAMTLVKFALSVEFKGRISRTF